MIRDGSSNNWSVLLTDCQSPASINGNQNPSTGTDGSSGRLQNANSFCGFETGMSTGTETGSTADEEERGKLSAFILEILKSSSGSIRGDVLTDVEADNACSVSEVCNLFDGSCTGS